MPTGVSFNTAGSRLISGELPARVRGQLAFHGPAGGPVKNERQVMSTTSNQVAQLEHMRRLAKAVAAGKTKDEVTDAVEECVAALANIPGAVDELELRAGSVSKLCGKGTDYWRAKTAFISPYRLAHSGVEFVKLRELLAQEIATPLTDQVLREVRKSIKAARSWVTQNERAILDDWYDAAQTVLDRVGGTEQTTCFFLHNIYRSRERNAGDLASCVMEAVTPNLFDRERVESTLMSLLAADHGEIPQATECNGVIETQPTAPTECTMSPTALSPSRKVQLFGQQEQPIVSGKEKERLTNAQYDVVLALLQAGERGLTKDELDHESKHGDARGVLKRLTDKDSDWRAVIPFPGMTGGGYRIL